MKWHPRFDDELRRLWATELTRIEPQDNAAASKESRQ